MLVTLLGIVILAKLLHPENAELPILVILSGIAMLVKLLQSRNAESPILVTLSGIVILVRLLQRENAEALMLTPPVITAVLKEDGIVPKIYPKEVFDLPLFFPPTNGSVMLVKLLQP